MLVTGVFGRFQEALSVAAELVEEGFAPKSLSLMARADHHRAPDMTSSGVDPGLSDTFATFTVRCGRGNATPVWANGPIAAALHARGGFGDGALLDALAAAGIGRTTAWYFIDVICSGRVLLSIHCDENRVRVARDILDGQTKPDAALGSAAVRLRHTQNLRVGRGPAAELRGRPRSPA